ncbi:MAG: hypothetical protein ABIR35_05535 [Polaromonas sp.]
MCWPVALALCRPALSLSSRRVQLPFVYAGIHLRVGAAGDQHGALTH